MGNSWILSYLAQKGVLESSQMARVNLARGEQQRAMEGVEELHLDENGRVFLGRAEEMMERVIAEERVWRAGERALEALDRYEGWVAAIENLDIEGMHDNYTNLMELDFSVENEELRAGINRVREAVLMGEGTDGEAGYKAMTEEEGARVRQNINFVQTLI